MVLVLHFYLHTMISHIVQCHFHVVATSNPRDIFWPSEYASINGFKNHSSSSAVFPYGRVRTCRRAESCAEWVMKYEHYHLIPIVIPLLYCNNLLATKQNLIQPYNRTPEPSKARQLSATRLLWQTVWVALSDLSLDKMAAILADDIFKCVSVNEKYFILIEISLKFVPKGPINNNPALVLVVAWRRIGDKLLSEPILTRFTDAYTRH